MAESVLRAALSVDPTTRRSEWSVLSAGTRARAGVAIHPLAAQVLDERQIPHAGFRSRQLSTELVRSAALILTAEREHRAAVTKLDPPAASRTFTLRQFARLVPTATPDDDLPSLIARAHLNRSLQVPVRPGDDDVADPIGKGIRAFRSCADELTSALALFGAEVRRVTPTRRWWSRTR